MHTFVLPIGFDYIPLAIFAHAFIIIACVTGLFYSHFKDNWAQTLGMFIVALTAALKIEQIRIRGFVSAETTLLAVGVAMFAAGVAWKVWRHQKEDELRRRYEKPHKARAK